MGPNPKLITYLNVPQTIATAMTSRLASKIELDTVYGIEDLWEILEVHTVNSHNERVIQE